MVLFSKLTLFSCEEALKASERQCSAATYAYRVWKVMQLVSPILISRIVRLIAFTRRRNLTRDVMERLRHVCHTEDRKVLVSIDRLDLCKVRSRHFNFRCYVISSSLGPCNEYDHYKLQLQDLQPAGALCLM